MRDLPFDAAFDVLTNFFTSFGYFQDETENERAMLQAARALKPGGRFFIDHVNAAFVRRTLVPESSREYKEYRIEERRWLDARGRRVNKTTKVSRGGEPMGEWGESVRLFEPEEFVGLLAKGRLSADRVFGDYTGAPLDAGRPRMILTGHKE
jgi:SAM-dependent methyltransferase